ncbi:MAG: iron-siderophore ABC transporter substrate-binding protein [Bacillaceae bacterium]|nr:iron-siderophore ABC transporter substrate-binding protein [Bacillaceae bacterium]
MKKRSGILFLITLLVLSLLAACGQKQEPVSGSAPESGEAVTEQETQEEAQAETRVVEHVMGSTEITGTPERVVVLYNGMVDIVLELGLQPVGAVQSWVGDPWYDYLEGKMDGVENLGEEGQPNLEAISALKPDLIIGSQLRDEAVYDQLSQIAPTVFSESVFDWKGNMTLAAEALNREAKAEQFLANWDTKVTELREALGEQLNSEVSIVRFDPDHARIYYTGYAGTILDEIGFSRPENQRVDDWGVKLTSEESIPEMNGDVIFDITIDWSGDGAVYATKEKWTSNPLWQNLDGVKNDQYHEVDAVVWNMAGGATTAIMMLDDLYEIFQVK